MQQEPGSHELSILHHLPMGLFVLDREWRFTFLNIIAQRFFQELCHCSPTELLGQSIWEKCPEVADSAFAKEHQQAVAEQRTFELEVFLPTLRRWFLMLAFSAEDCHHFYFKDTTASKRLERELRVQIEHMGRADRGKVEFLAHLTHKVRNTLGTFHNTCGLARRGPEAAEHALLMGATVVADLSPLLDDLLELTQLMLGNVEPGKESVDLTQIVSRVAEGIIPLPSARGRIFTLGMPSWPLWVAADPERLRNVVQYLLDNALAQTRPGDHIWLTAETQAGWVVLQVEDDGVGIAPEELPHIFDVFVGSEPATRRAQEKLRIRLALVRYLIELYGGKVEVRSDGPGAGSEFTVRMPETPAVWAGTPSTPSGVRVLVVDSNAMEAESRAELLNCWGYETCVAVDGPNAVLEAASWRPLVVLVEIALPGMDGREVARHLRSQAGPGGSILIAFLDSGQEKNWEAIREAGFDYFAVKPLQPETLRQLLEAVVARARQSPRTPPF